jgi:hypothetical protein
MLAIVARREKAAVTGREACEMAKAIIVDAEVPCETRIYRPGEKT